MRHAATLGPSFGPSPIINWSSPQARGLKRLVPGGYGPAVEMISGGLCAIQIDGAGFPAGLGYSSDIGAAIRTAPPGHTSEAGGWTFPTTGLAGGSIWSLFTRCIPFFSSGQTRVFSAIGGIGSGHGLHLGTNTSNNFYAGIYNIGVTTGTTTAAIGIAYDVCATCNGTTLSLYVNGVLEASAGFAATWTGPIGRVGCTFQDGNFPFTGYVNDFRFTDDRAWSAAEVAALSNPATKWQLYQTIARVRTKAVAAGAFSPAWAARANNLIGGGAWA